MIRVVLPAPLAALSGVDREVTVDGGPAPTIGSVIDAIEGAFPSLCGLIRDSESGRRRPFLRYYAAELDLSHEPPDTPLPDEVVAANAPFIVLGSISGG